MCEEIPEKKPYKPEGIEKDLIVEEFRQRYNQYRWEDETRVKFINFHIIFYLAFFGLIGFLSEHQDILERMPFSEQPALQHAIIFLAFASLGAIWLISIVSFRSIQILEGRTIKDIKELSPYLIDNVKYPIDRRIPKTNKLVYSTTPLVIIVFLLNQVPFWLSFYYFWLSCFPQGKYITLCINLVSLVILILYARFWQPSESSIKNLDYEKIW